MNESRDMAEVANCIICENKLTYRWTDTHSIGACIVCGAPYEIYLCKKGARINRGPETTLKAEWIPYLRRYWEEHKRNCCPGAFNIPGSSYEVATPEDFTVHEKYLEHNKLPEVIL